MDDSYLCPLLPAFVDQLSQQALALFVDRLHFPQVNLDDLLILDVPCEEVLQAMALRFFDASADLHPQAIRV